MSRDVSREGFDERKNYLGVHLQQGRPVLDSDWNESQHIAASMQRRLTREALGDGTPNRGFMVERIFPIPISELAAEIEAGMSRVDPAEPGDGIDEVIQSALGDALGNCVGWLFGLLGNYFFAPLMFFIQFPGESLDDCESLEGWSLEPPHGNLRLGRDVPFAGRAFLRLSGHPGTARLVRTLPGDAPLDLSAHELLVFRFRMSRQTPGPIRVFLEDGDGGRTTWTFNNPALAREQWMAGFATPLDVRLRIATQERLPDAFRTDPAGDPFQYGTIVSATGGVPPLHWAVTGGALPPGLSLDDLDGSGPFESARSIVLRGTPGQTGTFRFTLTATDDVGVEVAREFELRVGETSSTTIPEPPIPGPLEILQQLSTFEIGEDGPADVSRVTRYGFELYADPAGPLVWDIDDLRLGSSALYERMGENNFIIRGSDLSQLGAQLALMGIIRDASPDGIALPGEGEGMEIPPDLENLGDDLLEVLNSDFQIARPGIENAGRMYVAGYPCVLLDDVLYSEQADPADPPITTPAPGSGPRVDTVYLDVWEEPVTFVEDPEIRDVALGGPDTSTRMRLRHCVRVAQGVPMPTGSGRGRGLLATEGAYTGRDNRLFRVEVETPGQLGEATFRWSDENASRIARITRSVEPGTRVVLVEDGAGLLARDPVLIRCGMREERGRIASVLDNAVTLEAPVTGAYALADRPRLERWNAFGVAIPPDPSDPVVSLSIPLADGVRVRFGGRDLRRGDYWTFRTRYLARDQAAGVDPGTRIEDLGFVRPHGVHHHYAPLARIVRHPGDGGRIRDIRDLRPRTGSSAVTEVGLPPLRGLTSLSTTPAVEHVGGTLLPAASSESKFLVSLSGLLYVSGSLGGDPQLRLLAAFYDHERTDPATDPDRGRIQDQQRSLPLSQFLPGRAVPLHLTFTSSSTAYDFLPGGGYAPAAVEIFASAVGTGFTVELTSLRLTVVELKKST